MTLQIQPKPDSELKPRVSMENGVLDIYAPERGCTAWLKQSFERPHRHHLQGALPPRNPGRPRHPGPRHQQLLARVRPHPHPGDFRRRPVHRQLRHLPRDARLLRQQRRRRKKRESNHPVPPLPPLGRRPGRAPPRPQRAGRQPRVPHRSGQVAHRRSSSPSTARPSTSSTARSSTRSARATPSPSRTAPKSPPKPTTPPTRSISSPLTPTVTSVSAWSPPTTSTKT